MTAATVHRSLAAAAALAALASGASAQTVIVRNAPPSAPIELLLNADTVATATADSTGTATLTTDVIARLRRDESGMHVSVDECGQQRRILLVEAGVTAPPPGACSRATVRDLFSVQRITTFLVDVGGPSPVVWIRQGPIPPDWLSDTGTPEEKTHNWTPAPAGLILSGGIGGAGFSDFVTNACGDASTCSGSSARFALGASLGFWVSPWLGIDIGVLRSNPVKVTGNGTSLTFNSELETRIVIIDAKVGTQVGPVRIYGLGGVNNLTAATTTQQVVLNTIGAETFGFKSEGWGWLAGGGLETWVAPRLGLYVEGQLLSLKSTAIDNGEGTIDDRALYLTAGVRVSVGRKR